MAKLRLITLFGVFVLFTAGLYAQTDTLLKETYKERSEGWWSLQLDGGISYLTSDLKSKFPGTGVGLSFGRNLFYTPNNAFTSSLRLKLQYTTSEGYDTEPHTGLRNNTALNGSRNDINPLNYDANPGFIFPNFKSKLLETSLEVPLYFNPSKFGKSLHFGLFAGIGIGWYRVDIDQRTEGDLAYDYGDDNVFNTISLSDDQILDLLESNWDGNYETPADGFDDKSFLMSVMPALGGELGFNFNENMTLGISHRTSFARTDLLDGSQWKVDNTQSSDNDISHYTSLFLKWDILDTRRNSPSPSIELITPITEKINTSDNLAVIRTKIRNVKTINDISVIHNGRPYDVMQFYNKEFATNVPLDEGENTITITASNFNGTDQVVYNYSYVPDKDKNYVGAKPLIRFVQPEIDNQTVVDAKTPLKLDLIGVKNAKDVRIYINEEEFKDYTYSSKEAFLETKVNLKPGDNTVSIVAVNNNGVSKASRTIKLDENGAIAGINLIQPRKTNIETTDSEIPLDLLFTGDIQEKNILITLNNKRLRYDYDESSQHLSSTLNLDQGTNVLNVQYRDGNGLVEKRVTIVQNSTEVKKFDEPELNVKKRGDEFIVANFIKSQWNGDLNNCTYNLELLFPANIKSGDIEIFLNNDPIANVTVFEEEKVLRKALYLNEGRNYLKIRDKSKRVPVFDKLLNCVSDGTNKVVENDNRDNNTSDQNKPNKETKEVVSNEDKDTTVPSSTISSSLTPAIEVILPKENSSVLSRPVLNYKARLQNVSNRSEITMYYNDDVVSDYSFDSNTGILSYNASVIEEQNRITLIAINDKGVVDAVRFFKYEKLDPPSISILRPSNQSKYKIETVELKANILRSSKSDIKLSNNGKAVDNWSLEGNTLTANISLTKGVNKLELEAKNATANKSKTLYIYYNPVVAPVINLISSFEEGQELVNQNFPIIATITGVTEKRNVQFQLNGLNQSGFNFENGSFNANVQLKEGLNTIKIIASNELATDEKELKLNYRRPEAPNVILRNSSGTTLVTKDNPYLFSATAQHISSPSQLKIRLNGESVKTIDFNQANGRVEALLQLQEGINEIVIEAENQDGGDAEALSLRYVMPEPPVINLLNPKVDFTTEMSPLKFSANVLRVANRESIELFRNGLKTSFNFDQSTLNATISLLEGLNTIKLIASNVDGSVTKTIDVTYNKPVPPPILQWILPRESGSVVSNALYTLRLSSENIKSESQLSLKVNGDATPVKYNSTNGYITADAYLTEGLNNIEIKANNKSGMAVAESTINYEKPIDISLKKPKAKILTLNNPAPSAFDSSKGQSSFVGMVEKVDSQADILLLVNGTPITNFVYNDASGQIIATLLLKRGENKIVLKATNAFGSASDEKSISF